MSMRRLLPFLLLAAACAQDRQATGCRSDSQCSADARCRAGVCTADGRPVAALRPVGAVEAYALVELDGSASRDPDGEDAVAEHVWSVRAVDARCAPPEVAGRDPVARVRFGCPGRYEISLAVRDGLGVESTPATAEVDVLPATGEPVVAAGPDLATEHRCGGAPLVCRNEEVIRLAAAASPGLALRWSVEPPVERPLDGTRRVRFVPGPDAPAPVAELRSDGTALSGDWIFRVEALDAYGVVGAAHTRVSVRNRVPVVTVDPAAPFPHAFDAARAVFTASGALTWSVVDPDGDPVTLAGVWRHVGDGEGALFDGAFDGTTVTFAVEVPYATPADALLLRGGDGLSRRIELLAVDVNRGLGRGGVDVEIGNRPPVPAGGAFDVSVPHRFDAARSRYVATARAGTFVDPDGDPLVDSTGPGPCGTLRVDGNEVTVECAVAYEGIPAVDRLAGVRTFPVAVRDPWDVATAVPVRTLEIRNAPPVVTGAPSPATTCVFLSTASLPSWSGFSTSTTYHVSAAAFTVQPAVSDPDGDPVLVEPAVANGGSATPSGAVCTAPDCVPFQLQEPAIVTFERAFYPRSSLVASDGAARSELPVSPRWTYSTRACF